MEEVWDMIISRWWPAEQHPNDDDKTDDPSDRGGVRGRMDDRRGGRPQNTVSSLCPLRQLRIIQLHATLGQALRYPMGNTVNNHCHFSEICAYDTTTATP